MKGKKESIEKMLEMADERETEIIYFFVLHLVDLRGVEDAAPYKGKRAAGAVGPYKSTDCHTVVRDGSQ